jgi:regulation of enolase protein 1 (concanavalin A-like superfamily)
MIIKDDGPCFLRKVPADMELTMEVHFLITSFRQFDQAGLIVRFDSEHWLKTGIEVVDGIPRLSVVVTNGYSDWSTQTWTELSARIRVTQKGDGSYVVEAHQNSEADQSTSESGFHFIRIAQLQVDTSKPIQMGVFGCCPEAQDGCSITFSDFTIEKGSSFVHTV